VIQNQPEDSDLTRLGDSKIFAKIHSEGTQGEPYELFGLRSKSMKIEEAKTINPESPQIGTTSGR
jgi:hypothetical protein